MTVLHDAVRGCLRTGTTPMTSTSLTQIRYQGYDGIFNLSELPLSRLHNLEQISGLDVQDHPVLDVFHDEDPAHSGPPSASRYQAVADLAERRRFIRAVRELGERLEQGRPTYLCADPGSATAQAVALATLCRVYELEVTDGVALLQIVCPGTTPGRITLGAAAWSQRLD